MSATPYLFEGAAAAHSQMMAASDYYCCDCEEYFLLENMGLVHEPHGEYTVVCPYGEMHELETE